MAKDRPCKGKRPPKPYKRFPLFPHLGGSWCATVAGKRKGFGSWRTDPTGVLAKQRYDEYVDALHQGRLPVAIAGRLSVREVFNRLLARKEQEVDAGSLTVRSYDDYRLALAEFAAEVGPARSVDELVPDDFARVRARWSKRLGPHALSRYVGNVRSALRFAERNGLIDRAPRYGDQFDKAGVRERRRASRERDAEHGKRLFTPAEIRKLLKAKGTNPQLRAMILLGLNCGFLAIDCARLRRSDVQGDWLEFTRQKTETYRAAVLWPETVKALAAVAKVRPVPTDAADADLCFVTKYGRPWVHDRVTRGPVGIKGVSHTDAVSQAFSKLLYRVGIKTENGTRAGLNFSSLRKTFRTIADEAGDRNAALTVMGQAFKDMDAFYVRAISEARIRAVVEHVRKRLLSP